MGIRTLLIGKFAFCLGRSATCAVVGLLFFSGAGKADGRELVSWKGDQELGTVVVNTSERKLYYVLGKKMALSYDDAVGKQGMQWAGKTFVQAKRLHPGWNRTPRMLRENLSLPADVPPGPKNPLGVRVINLGWTDYRIHGTNAPWSIGRASSSGCIRMRNNDVKDLFERVHIGAPVHVIRLGATDPGWCGITESQGQRRSHV